MEAEYSGGKANLKITVDSDKPASDPSASGPLIVVREPKGEELVVGSRQRYAIAVGQSGQQAANVQWQPAFESEFVRWDPPVLYAKKAGQEQQLAATVGSQKVAIKTRIVGSTRAPISEVPPRDAKPESVRIVADQLPPIVMLLRGKFRDFRVEATFADGPLPLDVTSQATLRVSSEDPGHAPVAVEAGQLTGQRVGKAEIQASYNGVNSTKGLPIEVTDQIQLSTLEIEPAKIQLKVDESTELQVRGFSGSVADRRAVGDVAAMPGLEWKSADPQIVRVDGPIVTALKVGKSAVSVNSDKASATVEVTVAEADSTPGARTLRATRTRRR